MLRPILRVLSFTLAVVLAGPSLAAQAWDIPDLSPEARRAFSDGLAEVRTLLAARRFAAATARLQPLLAERPREAQARFLKGVLQTEQGEADAAIATFRALIEDYPEIPEPYNNLAVLYAQRGQIEDARVALETAVRAAPDWAVAHENLGDIHARLAAEHYARAVALDASDKTAAAKLVLAREILAPNTSAASH